ncbi:hypothetical protein CONPUDRAFT_120670 [Coniophora puteana RWD-64-598 SS2]|uniref:DUF1996 domain-containing protein n=1 Tax=Coniophora puteana (strain RWD-64-598) TaxID=741705 RepID=A0A5M3MV01_CONPW|nr:uncharacterized protein CONPUDRAFT_120670 [Coniophora puteana RWD-64-598 SS2]EIW82574.1 hypothetical protein CONPUDRAFT_120670 [Coniophora puteana RWD-64-598 SS2]
MFKNAFAPLLAALVYVGAAHAWFRVACTTPLVTERIDPIVSPGVIGTNHVHTVHGSSGFSATSNTTDLRAGSCTSCEVSPQDMSAYWFPKLYFKDPADGHFEEVPNGGLLVYYLQRGDQEKINGGPGLTAFPPGFRMISGDVTSRSSQGGQGYDNQQELAQSAIQWYCLRYTTSDPDYVGYGFPTTDCEAGFNARIQFPSCWDGENLDSPDHKSHVAYLSGLDNGSCPPTHPVGLMHMMFEITWDVHSFAGRWSEPDWPFVYATGDPTGYSQHGDFLSGWDSVALQNAIDNCNNPNDETGNGVTEACSYLTVISQDTATTCKADPVVNEQTGGTNLSKLPGCNPLQAGPQNATLYSTSNCPI